MDWLGPQHSKLQREYIRHRPKWYFLLPLAGSLAILLAVYLMNRGTDRMITRFYDPNNDPIVLALNQGTRGEAEAGIMLYQRALYEETWKKMSDAVSGATGPHYYLLASIELDRQDDAIERAFDSQTNHDHQLGQSIIWYTTLALIKSDRLEEAAIHLIPIVDHPGAYQTDARRLQKMLLK